jgi:hypothetical protein
VVQITLNPHSGGFCVGAQLGRRDKTHDVRALLSCITAHNISARTPAAGPWSILAGAWRRPGRVE